MDLLEPGHGEFAAHSAWHGQVQDRDLEGFPSQGALKDVNGFLAIASSRDLVATLAATSARPPRGCCPRHPSAGSRLPLPRTRRPLRRKAPSAGLFSLEGRWMRKAVPFQAPAPPGVRPSCFLMIDQVIASPRPEPFSFVVK